MKHLIITISAALFLATCGTEPKSQEGCEEGCKKENCEHEKGEKSCAADCKKDCCSKKETKLKIGDTNPALENKLMDVSGEEIYIEELGKKNGTLLIFSCNTCPFVVGNGEKSQGWENRYNDIQAMATELQNKIKQYDGESATKTDEENGKRLQEVQSMEQGIRQYQSQAQQDLQKKEFDLLKPITEKAKNAILKVGKAKGFDYVLDASQGQGIIFAGGTDLLSDVKTELGF